MGDFKHKHSLGQNFLKDKNVLAKIIDSCDVKEDDLVIEIGPGQGALTKFLKLYHCNLMCFEIDERVKPFLRLYEDDKTHIIFKDIMDVDIKEEIKDIKYNKLYVIANLPYYITTPIIQKMIDSKLDIEAMVLMVQDEVANRLSANPNTKDYGMMTVNLKYYYDVDKLFVVNRKSFEPIPNVDSAVIKLSKKDMNKADNEEHFFKLIKDSFMMKRKNIRNNLKKYDLGVVESVLKKYNLDLNSRAENIPLDCFIEMSNELYKKHF
ncbi:MAG: ribosomal RNA small subunit methyltransferase A [Bacilli bacterium]|nr:ribosomal RNA small subunit methyltransferase A [Bacilli bacterium]